MNNFQYLIMLFRLLLSNLFKIDLERQYEIDKLLVSCPSRP